MVLTPEEAITLISIKRLFKEEAMSIRKELSVVAES